MKQLLGRYKGVLILFAILFLFGAPTTIQSLSARLNSKSIEVPVKRADIYNLSQEQKLEDAEYLFSILEENYPLFGVLKSKYNYDWLADKSKFRDWIVSSNTPQEYYEAVNRTLTLLQDRHTRIIEPRYFNEFKRFYGRNSNNIWGAILNNKLVEEKYQEWSKLIDGKKYIIPAAFKYVEGKYALVSEMHGIPLGSELTAVNSESIDEYMEKNRDMYQLEIDYARKKAVADSLTLYGSGPRLYTLSFRTPGGESIVRDIQTVLTPAAAGSGRKDYSLHIIKENEIAYARFSSFQGDNMAADNRELKDFFQKVRHYPYLIIDIRGNTGGNTAYWKQNIVNLLSDKVLRTEYSIGFRNGEYIKSLAGFDGDIEEGTELKGNEYLKDGDYTILKRELRLNGITYDTGFGGRIYLLTDRRVYSAAEYMAYFAKKTSWATLVGTETGGGMNSEPVPFVLPNSGLIISFSGGIGIGEDGAPNSMNGTLPDIYAEQSCSDLLKELQQGGAPQDNIISPYDTVLNTVIKMLDKKPR